MHTGGPIDPSPSLPPSARRSARSRLWPSASRAASSSLVSLRARSSWSSRPSVNPPSRATSAPRPELDTYTRVRFAIGVDSRSVYPSTRPSWAVHPPRAAVRTAAFAAALIGLTALLGVLAGVAALVLPSFVLLSGVVAAGGRGLADASRRGERASEALADHLPYTAVIGFDHDLHVDFAAGPALREAGWDGCESVPESLVAHCRAALRGESEFLEHRTEAGRTQWLRVFPVLGPDGMVESGLAVQIDISDRSRAESALELERTITSQMAEGAFVFRAGDGAIVHANSALERMFGYSHGELSGQPFARVFAATIEHTPEQGAERLLERLRRRGRWTGELETVRATGTPFWTRVVVSSLAHADHGRVWVAVVTDISAEREALDALQEAEEDFRSSFEAAPIGMSVTGLDGRFLRVNRALCELTGYRRDELESLTFSDITHPGDRDRSTEAMRRLLSEDAAMQRFEKRYLTATGTCVPIELSVTLVRDAQGRPIHYLAQMQDVSARKQAENQLQYLADHDHLTGLFNRRRFEEELERQLSLAARYATGGAVLEIDLDDFKHVNDTLGHAAGDDLIAAVAGALSERLRATDMLARVGGDEFSVLLPMADADRAREVAEDVVATISRTTEGSINPLSASIGVTTFDGTENLTAEQLRIEADMAMYEAKEAGRGLVAVYDRSNSALRGRASRHTWEDRIREALASDRFVLFAQPIAALKGPRTARHELLVRMIGENGAPILPGAFLPSAEHHNLVQDIDRWVVTHSLEVLAAEQSRGHDVCIDVNLSTKSLGDPELAAFVQGELDRTGADSDGLVFDVPEDAARLDSQQAKRLSNGLSELGCHFALDDFGAGFATFQQLDHKPFEYLKIDGRLVRDLADNEDNQEAVRSLVELARSFDQATIAEFVTGPRTVEVLRELGVDYAQGFYVGRPRPVKGARLHEPPCWSASASRSSPYPCAKSRAPEQLASPSPPWRITTSWFQANSGFSSGERSRIQSFVVTTFHS